jgi:hypothetical protein
MNKDWVKLETVCSLNRENALHATSHSKVSKVISVTDWQIDIHANVAVIVITFISTITLWSDWQLNDREEHSQQSKELYSNASIQISTSTITT